MAKLLGSNFLLRVRRVGAYLINDTFTTNRAAGSINGTAAEPGPGQRTVLDTNGKLSIVSGDLTFAAGGVGVADPDLRYDILERSTGRVLTFGVTHTASGLEAGWDAAGGGSGNINDCIRVVTTTLAIRQNLVAITVGAVATSTAYRYAVVQRGATGHLYFIKGGAFTNWTLIWISAVGTAQRPNIVCLTTTTAGIVGYIRVPAAFWLPTPLASDGFGATFGTTDGLGHAEGVATGIGSGGSGRTYTQVGTWENSGGSCSSTVLSGGTSSLTYVDTGEADVIATVAFTRGGGDGGLLLRFADGNNFITCRHDGTNVILVKKVAGTNTTVQTTAATYVAGAELRVICTGSAFRVYYNNVLVGSEQTIADAALQTPTNYGLYTTSTANTFDDFIVYARGAGNEYVALDTIGNPLANTVWTGATWTLDGSGRAYNTPTLGAELLTNGNFASWSGDNPVGWTLSSTENAANFVTEVSEQARIVADSFWGIRQSVTAVGGWYQFGLDVNAIVVNTVRIDSSGVAVTSYSSTGNKLATARFPGTYFGIYRGSSGVCDFTVDNVSVKALTLSTTLATVTGTANDQTAAAKIHTLTTGTQAGVVSLLNSVSSPTNFLIAYHDGTNVKLDKCVAGTYTSLISTAVAFSSNAPIEIRRPSGNTFQLWYNGVQRGTDQTVSDAGIINNLRYGLFSTYAGNLFSEFSLGDYVVPFTLPGA